MTYVRHRSRQPVTTVTVCRSTASRMMRGTRLFRGGLVMDLLLLTVFLILAYVFVARRSYMSKVQEVLPNPAPREGHKGVDSGSPHLTDARVKKVSDYRSTECKNKNYNVKDQVTIVSVFFDYSFHDLQTSIDSVIHSTPLELIKEIIIIDDASTLDYIVDKSKVYAKGIEKARIIRNSKQLWTSGSRMKAFDEAQTDIVVFLDTNVVVAKGWLEPLIDALKNSDNVLAVPHYDSISDPVSYEYKATVNSLIASVSWSLAVRMTQTSDKISDTTAPMVSPALRGNAVAVKKASFKSLGAYDVGFQDGGGADLELSLRAWLCGSKVLVIPCSRVGVVNLQDPVKIVTHSNIRRIAELWFSGRKNLLFKNTGMIDPMKQDEQISFKERKTQLDGLNLKCQDIEWFFQNVAGHLPTPSEKAVHFGMLKCKTGRCARVGSDNRIDLGQCRPEHYDVPSGKLMFELTEDGLLTNGGRCLAVQPTAYVIADNCMPGETKQKWHYKDGKLINEWSQYCMMHVTDPDKKTDGKRQISMAQECGTEPDKQFVSFEFITL